MKRLIKITCALLVFSVLISSGGSLSSFDDYQDVKGHWAAAVLRKAYDDGLIDGYNGYLLPDESITTAQAVTMLCRVFNASTPADISNSGIPAGKWYYDYAAKALRMGLISEVSVAALESHISRQDAFCMLAGAFQLSEANPDMSVLTRFSDYGLIKSANRRALASMISLGLIAGDNGKFNANNDTTRAMFISVLYRIIKEFVPASDAGWNYANGVMLQGSVAITGGSYNKGVWFDCDAADIDLNGVETDRAVVRSETLNSLKISGSSHIGRLTLAARSGDIAVQPAGGAVVDTLVVGSGGGSVSVKGVDAIEITGNGRNVAITEDVESVVVSGRNSVIQVQKGAQVGKIDLLVDAVGSRVLLDGTVGEMSIMCMRAAVSGGGKVDTLNRYRADTNVNIEIGSAVDNIDTGITGASVKISAPTELPAGNTLSAAATIDNAMPGKVCALTWYIDGVQAVNAEITTGGAIPGIKHDFTYSRTMPESAEIKVTVRYTTILGEQQEISAVNTVKLQNYDKLYWMNLDAPDINAKVTLGYKGDYTLSWTQNNDLDDYDKEVWINTNGYTSASDYLLWVNLAYQRVNIFEWSDGYWALARTCIVGTGAPGRDTPVGVWETSYKQLYGWTTASYTVKPVVRFRGSIGYAFHSRLYYPNSDTLIDASIGYPISHGCIRMYDEDVWFIYDNVPDGTTVVVH
ncbi:MAG: L,D-transpeptidase family protein [Oscillospiraceae bacterium]|nr:L,D-transpeptidase family protein [Oscillospiraceae bacterium]